ncbi:MAG: hypothetical protein FWC70_10815 [Defluviitaleaceae bacterium]|nr:hypothetical protein [Defluviitaleaceae bacterium]
MNITTKSIRDNLCRTCVFAIPQEGEQSLGLVDCPKMGYGNASSSTIHPCEHYRENDRLLRLKNSAVEAIQKFATLNAQHTGNRSNMTAYQRKELDRAAAHSCAMTEAYSLICGISYDTAAELLNEEAKSQTEEASTEPSANPKCTHNRSHPCEECS